MNMANFNHKLIVIGLALMLSMVLCSVSSNASAQAQWQIKSPDGVLSVVVKQDPNGAVKYRVEHIQDKIKNRVLAWSDLGFKLTWHIGSEPTTPQVADFGRGLKFASRSDSKVEDRYTMLTGKRLENHYLANESRLTFKHAESGKLLRLDIQVANDGFAMRYALPQRSPIWHQISDETTSFNIGSGGQFWAQPYHKASVWTPSYEAPWVNGEPIGTPVTSQEFAGWAMPSLFAKDNGLYLLLHESNLGREYHGSHLQPSPSDGVYKIAPPLADSAHGFGRNVAATQLPVELPWRFMVVSSNLSDIVESNRVFDLAAPNKLKDIEWVAPGVVSWSWLSDHTSSRDIAKMTPFIDLAAERGWPYSLIDANWNLISDSSMQELVDYASQKGVALAFWYNSGGRSNFVTEEPRNIMDSQSRRRAEFAKLQKLGVKAVKVDFFHSDKQDMIDQYIGILEDAAEFEIMVVFHGCTIPRGWERTYPNLMSMESVRGAEFYTFESTPNYAELALYQNTILPFTRNVIGSMDYTPVLFNDYHTPGITTHAHEAALAVLFESGFQHLSDSVKSYRT